MCRVYGVTRAGFYAWRSRERSERERQNETLAAQIRAVHRNVRRQQMASHLFDA